MSGIDCRIVRSCKIGIQDSDQTPIGPKGRLWAENNLISGHMKSQIMDGHVPSSEPERLGRAGTMIYYYTVIIYTGRGPVARPQGPRRPPARSSRGAVGRAGPAQKRTLPG